MLNQNRQLVPYISDCGSIRMGEVDLTSFYSAKSGDAGSKEVDAVASFDNEDEDSDEGIAITTATNERMKIR